MLRGVIVACHIKFSYKNVFKTTDFSCLYQVALDMINPHLALPAVVPHLHSGSVCAVYQAK